MVDSIERNGPESSLPVKRGPGKGRGMKRFVAAVLVAGSATLALSAWSHVPHRGGPGAEMGMGPGVMGFGPGGPGGPGGRGGDRGPGGMDPERMVHRVDFMLDGLNATDAQRAQIKEIVRLAAVDLKAQRDKGREDGRAMREKGVQLFTAPTIDAAGIEALRAQMQARQDLSSKRVTQAMIDVARVLTPEQRAKAGDRLRFDADRMQDREKRMSERPDAGRGRPDRRGPPPVPPSAPAR
ncbi:hypothetical protein BH09PSE5_BH09PSE5_43340 [soil metagenome]